MNNELSDEFPFSEYARLLEKSFSRFDGRLKYSAKNAFQNLRLSWRLRSVDPSMSAFRAITAEEEAATALLFVLRKKQYPHCDRINYHKHDHKAAVFVLIQTVSRIFARLNYSPQVYLVDIDTQPKIRIQLDINEMAGIMSAEPAYAEPLDPLDFSLTDQNGRQILVDEFAEFCGENGFAKMVDYLRQEANLRNRLLYASDSGIPSVNITDEFIQHRKDRVVAILTIALMIQQTDKHQGFVVQCLDALLSVLIKLDIATPDMSSFEIGSSVQIVRTPESSLIEVVQDGRRETAHFEYRFQTEFNVKWLEIWRV
jgi:hypothetical protein